MNSLGLLESRETGVASRSNPFVRRIDHAMGAHFHDLDTSFQGRYCHDLYDPARVAGWERYNLHDLGHVSWGGSVLYRSYAAPHNGSLGSR